VTVPEQLHRARARLDLDGRATWRFPPVEDPRERALLEWTELALQLEVDFVALSFVRSPDDGQLLTRRPYFFPDLAETTEADEQTAIDAALIQPTRIDYLGTRR